MAYSGPNPAEGIVSVGNSTVVNLAANAVFTGTAEDIILYANIKTTIYSSHVSATNGLTFQQSHDGVLWIPLTDAYTIPALVQRPFSIPPNMKWYRVVYTNGPTLTTTLVIQTIYHKSDKQPSSVKPQDSRSNENDFVEVLSYLMGYNSLTDAWNRIGITNAVTGGNENLVDRIKVNAALRMIDNAQPSGSKLVNVTGTQAGGMDVNMSDRAARILGVVTPPVITKGTQGANGFTTQDLKDAGRSQIMLSWEEITGTAAVESTLTNYTLGSKGGTALGTFSAYTVTTGKTLRIQSVNIYIKATAAVINLARFRIRQAASVLNTSPVIWDAVLTGSSASVIAANGGTVLSVPIPDGLEVAAGQQITFTFFTTAITCTVGMSIIGYEY